MVSVSLPLFLALAVLAAIGLGYVCCVIADSLAAPDRPFFDETVYPHPLTDAIWTGPSPPPDTSAWWSEDDVTATIHEIREL